MSRSSVPCRTSTACAKSSSPVGAKGKYVIHARPCGQAPRPGSARDGHRRHARGRHAARGPAAKDLLKRSSRSVTPGFTRAPRSWVRSLSGWSHENHEHRRRGYRHPGGVGDPVHGVGRGRRSSRPASSPRRSPGRARCTRHSASTRTRAHGPSRGRGRGRESTCGASRRNSCDKRRLITTKRSERPVQKSFMFPGSSRPGGLPARASALGH